MFLPITDKCSQNCLFCSATGRNANTDRKFFLQRIEQSKDRLTISGGEPTLSPDLFWVIKEAKKKKLFIEFQTNGNTLYYKDLVSKLVKSGIDLFNINFSSHLSSINDKITQTKGLFKNKIEGIKNLQAVGANIRLTCVVNALNYKDLQDYVIFVKQNFPKIKYIQFSFIKIMGQAKKNPQILITYEKVQPYLLKAFKKCLELNIDFITDHIPLCYLDDFIKYHIDYQKIASGKESDVSLKEKVKLKECADCRMNHFCYGVRKDYLDFFGKKTKVKPIKN